MNICLIGKNISNLLLAKNLVNRGINFDLLYSEVSDLSKISTRTVGISEDNINFINSNIVNIKKYIWSIKDIKIYTESDKDNQILSFKSENNSNFSIIKYYDFYKTIEKVLNKSKNFKTIFVSKKKINNYILNKKYNLIVNSDAKNSISKKYFYKKYFKDYNSKAYTTIINHKICFNKAAYQIFTKFGPLAFLPISKKKTSVVFSIINKKNDLKFSEVKNLIKYYNTKYNIKSFEKIEKFKLNFSCLKKYYFKNILCLGDSLHQIHPLAGQGLNMTIRDIRLLSKIIDSKICLGLPLDQNILEEFEKKIKHFNFSFAKGIDLIYEFFKLDDKLNNRISNLIVKPLSYNKHFKNYIIKIANRGLYL